MFCIFFFDIRFESIAYLGIKKSNKYTDTYRSYGDTLHAKRKVCVSAWNIWRGDKGSLLMCAWVSACGSGLRHLFERRVLGSPTEMCSRSVVAGFSCHHKEFNENDDT